MPHPNGTASSLLARDQIRLPMVKHSKFEGHLTVCLPQTLHLVHCYWWLLIGTTV